MLIDVIFLFVILGAVVKGLQRGLIVAVFSFIACIVGLAAAIKLSAIVAGHLRSDTHVIPEKWLPVLAFLLVFIGVALLIGWLAGLLSKAVDFTPLGILNKLGGVAFYLALYSAIFSILLFYGTRAHIIPLKGTASSKVYHYIAPWGPWLVNEFALIFPFFKNMFRQLSDFFGNLVHSSRYAIHLPR
jgi:membrane protein required for colicin V production